MVLRRCRRLLGDEERSLDAMQDVFVQVLRHQHRLEADAPSSLLYRIATRTCLNLLRGSRRDPVQPAGPTTLDSGLLDNPLLAAIAEAPDEAERLSARRLLARLFGREPESTRVLAVLHLVDGLTLEETAAEVGLSVSGVRKRLRTLRERLGALAPPEAP